MTGFSDSTDIRVVVNGARTEARLFAPAGTDLSELTAEHCFTLLSGCGVRVTGEVGRAVEALVSRATAGGVDLSGGVLVARAKPATPGVDGTLTWLVDEEEASAESEREALSFYDRSAFVVVEEGQHIGDLTDPTPGEDGVDVLGAAIAAKPGQRVPVRLDESIFRDATGRLIAQSHGVLHRSGKAARITPAVEVPGSVDFSSGNIDFEGDAVVREGVRDCFSVKVTGDADIAGLIEAAEVRCGGSLTARMGMAGRGKGRIDVAGDVHARYLGGVRGAIRGALLVDREIIDCRLEVGGDLRCAGGVIIRSEISVAGAAEVGTLGGASDRRTVFALGTLPFLEAGLRSVRAALKKDVRLREQLDGEKRHLEGLKRHLPSELREKLTEVYFELRQAEGRIAEGEAAVGEIEQRLLAMRSISFSVNRELHADVRIRLVEQSFRVLEPVKGPIRIGLDRCGKAVYRRGHGPQRPLTEIAVPIAPEETAADAA